MSLFRTLRTSNFAHPAQARRIRFPPVSQVSFFRTLSARLKQRTQPTAHRPGQDCVRSASQHRRFPLRSTRLSGWKFSRNFCRKEHRGHPSIALHALQRGRHWPERLLSARAVHRPCPDLCVPSSERSPSVGSPVDGGGAECARRTRGRGSTSACARPSTVLARRFRQMVAACGLGRLHGVAAAETPATPAARAVLFFSGWRVTVVEDTGGRRGENSFAGVRPVEEHVPKQSRPPGREQLRRSPH